MAKKSRSTKSETTQQEEKIRKDPLAAMSIESGPLRTISVPCHEEPHGYISNRIDIRLNGDQATILKAVLLGLDKKRARLKSGRYVTRPAHALQWILENI